jgi:hypothetical protein
MTTAEMRAAVEARWEWFTLFPPDPTDGGIWLAEFGDKDCIELYEGGGFTEALCIQAAYAFTLRREEEIRQVDEEIDSLKSDVRWFSQGEQFEDRPQAHPRPSGSGPRGTYERMEAVMGGTMQEWEPRFCGDSEVNYLKQRLFAVQQERDALRSQVKALREALVRLRDCMGKAN